MSRIINTESNNTQRKKLLEGMAAALRYASVTKMEEKEQQDILAFLVLSLKSIENLNEKTIIAWEKRGYWIKADRFRMDWRWVQNALQELECSFSKEDIQSSILTAAGLAQHLTDINLSSQKRSMRPWINAWVQWKNQAR
ncbi:MAG: hypothetical protein JXA25_07635 [Anaerolineales bacterium]|nr:hypothetical protein [Anaerolineales bacterium]